ncbi:MAG: type II toxin-antitoxin system mRNA interferase toxin, RelE/StbE family [Novosphingobium sp.]
MFAFLRSPVAGNLADHRDCHIRPDLVRIDQRRDNDRLRLLGLGSHSELGL